MPFPCLEFLICGPDTNYFHGNLPFVNLRLGIFTVKVNAGLINFLIRIRWARNTPLRSF